MGNSDHHIVISSDGHAGASRDGYRDYLEKRWYDEFDTWVKNFADPWSALEPDDFEYGVASLDSRLSWDSSVRQAVIEGEGVVAEVLFPNTAPPFFPSGVITADAPRTPDEYERRFAGLKAHNSWLADFCNELPGRRAGLGQIFLNDVDETVAEIKRIKELGLKGILLPADAANVVVPVYSAKLDPVWQISEELELPIHRHSNVPGAANSIENGPAGPVMGMMEAMFFLHRGLAHLVFAGVFERFPGLKYVTTEGGVGWVPGYLSEMDMVYESGLVPGSIMSYFATDAIARLSRKPSEYFQTNCYLGASLLTGPEAAMRETIGQHTIMWGSDLPHREGTYPFTRLALRAAFADIPEQDTRQMLAGNAAEVYGFDLEALQLIADKVCPTVEEVARPLTSDEYPRYPEETVSPPLALETVRRQPGWMAADQQAVASA